MPVSPLQAAKQALVTLLLALAAAYNVAIAINRESEDEALKRAFRRVSRLDREDLVAKKSPIQRAGFQARVRKVLATQKAQRVASKIAGGFRRKCKVIVSKKGKTMARG